MSLGLIIFKSSLIDFRWFSVVYPNRIKRILAYAIKLLAYTKVLKNTTLLSLILQILTKEYMLNWDLLSAPLYVLKKYSNLMPNSNLIWLNPTNITITGLIEYIIAGVQDTAEGTTSVDHKAIVEVLKIIGRRSAIFIKSQIASQLGTLLIGERRHIISFARVQETLEIIRLL